MGGRPLIQRSERKVPHAVVIAAAGYNRQLRHGYRAMIREVEANRRAALAEMAKQREQP
jgi:hypothetical protein